MKADGFVKEPFDCRLMFLRLIRCIHMPILGILMGALILGSGYYLWNGHLSGEDTYRITSEYEVTYAIAPQSDNEYTYINGVTWNSWLTTDVFTEMILEEYEAGDHTTELSKAQLEGYLAATLPSDLGMPSTIVTTPDADLAVRLDQALQKAMLRFGEEKIEIATLRVVDTDGPILVDRTPRTVQASVLGAVSGALFVLFVMFVKFCLNGAIWVPETFTYRYGVPMIGTLAAHEEALSETDAANVIYLAGKCLEENAGAAATESEQMIALTAVDPQLDLQAVMRCMPGIPGAVYVCVPSVEQVPESYQVLREAAAVFLAVKAGEDGEERIRHMLENMRLQDVTVTGAILTEADRTLLKAYYLLPI